MNGSLSDYARVPLGFPEAPECRRFVVIASQTVYENTARDADAKIVVLIARLPDDQA